MGAIHDQEEDARAVEILRNMPREARVWLNHHVGNAVQVLLNAEFVDVPQHAVQAAQHIIEDMKRIDCFQLHMGEVKR